MLFTKALLETTRFAMYRDSSLISMTDLWWRHVLWSGREPTWSSIEVFYTEWWMRRGCTNVYFGNLKKYGLDLDVRVIKMRYVRAFGKSRVYESVIVLGGAIRADFVPQCFMKACRAGRLQFSPIFLHILSALFGIQIKRSRKTHESII